jgi:hypothetical protein
MALDIVWTRKAKELPPEVIRDLARRLDGFHKYFPEIRTSMKIGISRSYDGLAFQSDDGHVQLMLGVRRLRNGGWRLPTHYTIAHELMHLVQFNSKDIPSGERACDVYALARLPPEFIDESPTYLVVPRGRRGKWTATDARMAHELAVEALQRRARGVRRYASWWEEEFERRVGR